MFQVEGHEWPIEPYMPGADMISVVEFGGSETLDVFLRQGAGGPSGIPGDYIWANARLNYQQAGQWGYLRVLPTGDQRILPLGAMMSNAKRVESHPEPQVLPTAMMKP